MDLGLEGKTGTALAYSGLGEIAVRQGNLAQATSLLEESRIVPCRFKDKYAGQRGLTFVPFLVLANKNDDAETDENFEIFRELLSEDWPLVSLSVATGRNLQAFKKAVVERLDIIRVYSKSPGKKPDQSSPFTLKNGSTVADFAAKIHKDFVDKFKAAKVWGTSVYDGQLVQRDYVLQDGDVVELQI